MINLKDTAIATVMVLTSVVCIIIGLIKLIMINLKDTAIAIIMVLTFVVCIIIALNYGVDHCKSLYDNNDEVRQCLNI